MHECGQLDRRDVKPVAELIEAATAAGGGAERFAGVDLALKVVVDARDGGADFRAGGGGHHVVAQGRHGESIFRRSRRGAVS